MKVYVVEDNYGELERFSNYEDAAKFIDNYVLNTLPYITKVEGACGITEVRIHKEEYEKIAENKYKFLSDEVLFTTHIV